MMLIIDVRIPIKIDDVVLLTFSHSQGHVVHSTLHQLKIHFLSLKVCLDY